MKKIRITCYILIVLFLILYLNSIISYKIEIKKENNIINYSLNKEVSYRYIDVAENNYYDMILSIPKINLKKGIYDKDDYRNNIDYNVTIHSDSDYPDQVNSNVILYAHSGVGKKAFFNDLIKLDHDSLIELYYNHTKYIYKLDNIYNVDKNNKIRIIHDKDKNCLTLITCSQSNKDEQIVFISYLIDKISY